MEEEARLRAALNGGEVEHILDDVEKLGSEFSDSHLTREGLEHRATYPYTIPGEDKPCYQVLRYEHPRVKKKRFIYRRRAPNAKVISWVFGAGPIRILYRWPDIAARPDEMVQFTEGEKKANMLATLGLVATTVASQKWTPEAVEPLRGRDVAVHEDNDERGRENATNTLGRLAGVAKSLRLIRLPGLKRGEGIDDWIAAGHTKEELLAIVAAAPTLGLRGAPHDFPDEKTLAPWQWLYGKHLLRGAVAGTAATGGTGKTILSVAEALAMASGKDLLGIGVPPDPSRVLLINLEDNRNTVDKLVAAAMKQHDLKPEDIGGRLFTAAKGELQLALARQRRGAAAERNEGAIGHLVDFLREHEIDVLSVDPLIRTHAVNENDNEAMSIVVGCYEEIAEQANCAVGLWHHTRKGNGAEATVESARGAQAFVDSCRSVRVLDTMSREEARKLGVEGGYYFREFSGKRNHAPPSAESTWYEKKGVELNNGGFIFDDCVGVVVKWQHPGADAGDLSTATIAAVREKVASASWREDFRSGMWVGKAVAQAIGLNPDDGGDRERIKGILKELKARGVLKDKPQKDEQRRERLFTVVG
jgi:hypothetical protein